MNQSTFFMIYSRVAKTAFSILIGIFIIIVSSGCSSEKLTSIWKSQEILIDGDNVEWENTQTFFDDKNISISVMNDKKFLYLCLATTDQQIQRQFFNIGLTVWFDQQGEANKKLGIGFPVGKIRSRQKRGEMRASQQDSEWRQNPERREEMMMNMMQQIEIIRPETDQKFRLEPAEYEANELALKAQITHGILVYELQIPLLEDEKHPYAVGTETNQNIEITLETTKFDFQKIREEMRERAEGGRSGGNMGGMRSGGGRGSGRMGGGRRDGGGDRPQMPEQLRMKIKVALAPNPE